MQPRTKNQEPLARSASPCQPPRVTAKSATLKAGLLTLCQFVAGCVSADRFLLHPTNHPVPTDSAVRERIPFEDGVIEIWKARTAAAQKEGTKLYVLTFYGNADRADRWPAHEVELWKDLPVEVWGVNHPGYGGTTGPARLDRIAAVATAACDHLRTMAGGKPIIVSGTSLGSTAALHLAACRPVSGVITRSPTPLRQTAMYHGWWNLWLIAAPVAMQIPSDLDSVKNAQAAKAPAVFLVTSKDDLVTPACQRLVIDAYGGEKRSVILAEAGHNSPLEESETREFEAALAWLYAKATKNGR